MNIDSYRHYLTFHYWKFRRCWTQFSMALVLMDWSPRRWALDHDNCKDLTFGWWLAGVVLDEAEKESFRRLLSFIERSNPPADVPSSETVETLLAFEIFAIAPLEEPDGSEN